MTSTQIINAEIFVFEPALVFTLLSCKVLLINKKCKRKLQISRLNYCKIIHSWDAKCSGYF